MKLVIAADFSAYILKDAVKAHLIEEGHEIVDVGHMANGDKVVYPQAVSALVQKIRSGECERGILFCGTGAGVSIAANKFKGIYCVPCESVFTASKSPVINNANVLAMGYNVVGPENGCRIADMWLSQSFCNGFAPERAVFIQGLFAQLQQIEEENFK